MDASDTQAGPSRADSSASGCASASAPVSVAVGAADYDNSTAVAAASATVWAQDSNGEGDAGPRRGRPDMDEGAGTGTGAASTAGTATPRRATSPHMALSRHSSPTRDRERECEATPHLDLANYPTPTLLRMLASLLQQIASANDQLRAEQDEEGAAAGTGAGTGTAGGTEPMQQDTQTDAASATGSTRSSLAHPSPTTELFHDQPPQADLAAGDRLFTASKVSLSHPSSILSFHARHVPSISIEAYLLRILKYCPTTNEVFLGLLVYFDRMSKLGTPVGVGGTSAAVGPRGFAIDSYNVHRLIIAGVTVASKFFSDVFYTNSRYAKVGGLPPHELNQLELQFLLLNNFTLMIPPEEMQKYGDRLLVYWQSNETEASEPESKHCREEQRERERTGRPAQQYRTDGTHTPAPAHAQAQPAQTHPAQPQAAGQASAYATPVAQASATAPATPMAPPAQLSRSASLPRHPPQVQQAQTDAVRGRERDRERPAVSFTSSGLAKAAPVASGF